MSGAGLRPGHRETQRPPPPPPAAALAAPPSASLWSPRGAAAPPPPGARAPPGAEPVELGPGGAEIEAGDPARPAAGSCFSPRSEPGPAPALCVSAGLGRTRRGELEWNRLTAL